MKLPRKLTKEIVVDVLSTYLRFVEIDFTLKVFGKVLLTYHYPPIANSDDLSD